LKYILILGEYSEKIVDEIIHWIIYYTGLKIIRLNVEDKIEVLDISISNTEFTRFKLKINSDITIDSNDIFAYYYRRGYLRFYNVNIRQDLTDNDEMAFVDAVTTYYKEEGEHIINFIYYMLDNCLIKSLNSYTDNASNKLINLEIAKKFKFKIPDTIISNSIDEICRFVQKYRKVVTKPIRYPNFRYVIGDDIIAYSQPTNIFTIENLNLLIEKNKNFQPTQFQEYIEKDFEVRVYYMSGKCYSMAIFSQGNEKTRVDFRNYEGKNPNRFVPYQLPKEVEEKIFQLMQFLDYDSGSLDLIYSNSEYTFLEINTVGIFQWVSKYCNYYIEKEISCYLID
jgi:ATP-GRASP peptide maturase of grasp-with-spasm system